MVVTVTMPQLGESVSEGTVTRWLKQEGDHVEADEPLLEVSTDKVDTEVPAPASGILTKITVGEDETVEVGQELAIITDEAGAAAGITPATGPAAAAATAMPEPASIAGSAVLGAPATPAPGQAATPAPVASSGSATGPEPVVTAAPEPAPEWESAGSPVPVATQDPAPAVTAVAPPVAAAAPTPQAPVATEASGVYVTPLVRRLAAENHVDLTTLQGTGVGGRIRKQDVLDAAQDADGANRTNGTPQAENVADPAPPSASAPPSPPLSAAAPSPSSAAAPARPAAGASSAAPSPLRGHSVPLTRLRRVIAERMVDSLRTAAQLTTVVEADVTAIARLRARAKDDFVRREGTKLSFLPFFALAAVEALKAHPAVNASIDLEAGTVTYHDAEHLGIAVDTERGLLVPVIHDAGDLNLGGMARKIADLAERTRSSKVSPDELGGGTFTLTNTGSRGALFDTPIINQPQVAILGTGTVVKRPVVVDDADLGEVIAVRSTVYLALTYDHRLVDGADAARFLGTVKDRLEDGDFEAELGL